MESQHDEAVHLLTNLETAPTGVVERLATASALSDDEIATVQLALNGAGDAVSALALRMLDEWATLTPGERIAGLLVLFEQLAAQEGMLD